MTYRRVWQVPNFLSETQEIQRFVEQRSHQAFRIDDPMDPMDFLKHMCSTCRGVVGPSVEKSSMVRQSPRAGSLIGPVPWVLKGCRVSVIVFWVTHGSQMKYHA